MGVKLIIGIGAGVDLQSGTVIRINTYNYKLKNYSVYFENDALTGGGINFFSNIISAYKKCIVFRSSSVTGMQKSKIIVYFDGIFNFDMFSLDVQGTFTGRVELRNDENVLITDNGKPWGDGTYPPDAKNRAGLAGLHAVPAVINPELETALMGDETDKERVQE